MDDVDHVAEGLGNADGVGVGEGTVEQVEELPEGGQLTGDPGEFGKSGNPGNWGKWRKSEIGRKCRIGGNRE